MSDLYAHAPHAPEPQPSRPVGRDASPAGTGLLLVGLATSALAAVAAGVYGQRFEVPASMALATQLGLASLTLWAVRDAIRIRALSSSELHELRSEDASPADTAPSLRDDRLELAPTEEIGETESQDVGEAVSMHVLFLTVPAAALGAFALFQLWTLQETSLPPHAAAAAILALAAASGWNVLARAFQAIAPDELPESRGVSEQFRESLWATLLSGGTLLAASALPAAPLWGARILLLWTTAAAMEQTLRGILCWCAPPATAPFISPVGLLLREAVLLRSSPIASLFDVIERRFGLSLRSTWALQVLRAAVRLVLLLALLIVWGTTGLAVVDSHQWGVREAFGQIVADPLPPGLHASLPWPLGRIRVFPVKSISTMQVGFQDAEFGGSMTQRQAILWTKPHDAEFSLVLGTGTELVAVNAVVYFKIAESEAAFRDYVLHHRAPERALESFAYRVLMEETCGASLADILSRSREEFGLRLLESLRQAVAANRLGLEVIDVALVNLHPPVGAAGDYLDTISAAIDADRLVLEARGEIASQQQEAAEQSHRLVSEARIEAERRLAAASEETSRFRAARDVFHAEGAGYQTRLLLETLGEVFRDKRLVLIDRALAERSGELLIDLRDLLSPGPDAATERSRHD